MLECACNQSAVPERTNMAIAKNSVVSLHYEMYDANNQLLDKTEEPIAYLHGGYDGIFPLVEEALHGKDAGDTVDVALSSDDAFGEQDSELVRIEDAGAFPVEVEVGMMFEADDPETGDVVVYRVTDVADGKAVVDGNHPLAGMKIRFKATVESVRDASDEEIAHGHVHGSHGHYHH
ncbi:putative peptidyl-prolyl cis-trans isomerase [Neisseria gonorrhoeae NCCP11945]|nr:putative peptidyl-prolyl cis-trans isomerase [Neisseria gonorrhoeae NCCP11945]